MERTRRFGTWIGALLGVFLAVLLNVALARGSDDNAVVTEEFHHTYPLSASGRIELANINGAVHVAAWDQNEVKLDAVKRADNRSEERRVGKECRSRWSPYH